MTSKTPKAAHEGGDTVMASASSADEGPLSMVLWTRRPVCGPRTSVIDRLNSLDADDAIAEFDVQTWPDEIAISEHTEHTRVVERYKEFELWATEADVSITPPFERRTVSSLVGKSEDVLTVPIMCLAVYDGDTLCGVYPHSDGGQTTSVADYLDFYESAVATPADP